MKVELRRSLIRAPNPRLLDKLSMLEINLLGPTLFKLTIFLWVLVRVTVDRVTPSNNNRRMFRASHLILEAPAIIITKQKLLINN